MCRLYAFRSNEPREIECELIAAQNSLLRQSTGDAAGETHRDGWGLGHYLNGEPFVVRQAIAAAESEEFRWAASEVYTTNALAHVRHATVGVRREENTHPFQLDRWMFAHNGTIATFPALRSRMLAAMTPAIRERARGETDSEHLFHMVISHLTREPALGLRGAVRATATQVLAWSAEEDRRAEVALNIVVTDGAESTILRQGRTLSYVRRDTVHPCQICDGALHVRGTVPKVYRAVVFSSEPITTDEAWTQATQSTIFTIDAEQRLSAETL